MKRNKKNWAWLFVILFFMLVVPAAVFASSFMLEDKDTTKTQAANDPGLTADAAVACPQPILRMPVDIDIVTSLLYPGQTRGGDYKPHGGFRFDGLADNSVEIVSPMNAKLTSGARYIEQGEEQVLLDFQSECGIHFRLDHLRTLSPKLQAAVQTLPDPKPDDSRTTNFEDPVAIKSGEVIATSVGLEKTRNVFVDFGVYDVRSTGSDGSGNSQREHAVCLLDYLPDSDANTLRALPAGDLVAGKTSDYCK